MKKIFQSIKLFFYSLIYGMKKTEDIVFKQTGEDINSITINQNLETKNLAKALLKGEVTQEVEELRYRTYLVDKESKTWEYYTPTLALKKIANNTKPIKYDDTDGLKMITSQLNDLITSSFDESMKDFVDNNDLIRHVHRIKIKRDFTPRYKLEDFATRIDVKRLDEKHAILDIFVSFYGFLNDIKTNGFLSEIRRIKNEGVRSDSIEFDNLSFITSHAYNISDHIKFVFKNLYLKEIKEFDGHYILRFKASFSEENLDPVKKYYSKTMDEKYKNKEPKKQVLNLFDYVSNTTYVCEECGKEVILDNQMMDELEAYNGRDITEEKIETDNVEVAEFLDMQISEQTFGKRLCSKCLNKYMKINGLI